VFNGRHAGIGADIKLAAGARSFERTLMKILDQNGR
jgi:hypothetical protein